MNIKHPLLIAVLMLVGLLLAACNNGNGTGTLSGTVYGGQSPVSGSTVTLYAVGSSPAAASVLGTGTTDANGDFNISSFTCPSSTTQTYMVASGGNPGLTVGTNNGALHMMAALGDCGAIPRFINIDEVTTVAAAYALNGFIGPSGCVDCAASLPTDVDNVSTSASNTLGLSNAMLTAARLASVVFGTASPPLPSASACGTSTPPVNCGAEQKLDSLANSLAACVNTTGGSSSQCVELFNCATPGATFSSGNCTVAGGVTPASDTLQAILYIARNPGLVSMTGVYDVATQKVVFSPALTAAPTDWALALNITGGGLNAPEDIAIDASGNVWVASDGNSTINEFDSSGTTVSTSGYTGGGLNHPAGVAIDAAGNVWVSNYVNPGVLSKFNSSGTPLSGTGYTGGGLNTPDGIAIDASGNVWVASDGNSTINEFNSSGTPLSGSGYTGGGLDYPGKNAIDATGNVWVTSESNSTVNEFSNSGTPLSGTGYTGGGLNTPNGIAIDASGNVWVASDGNSTINEFDSSGTTVSTSGYTGGGLNHPVSVAIDAAGNVWTISVGNHTVNEFNSTGTALSPSSGFTNPGLSYPLKIAIDASGNVWVANYANNSLTELIGAAAPTRTPLVEAITQGFTP